MRVRAGPVRPWAATRAVRVRYIPTNTSTSEPQVSIRRAAYNYFYDLVSMTCNHDIAYLVRNAYNANACVQSMPAGLTRSETKRDVHETTTCCAYRGYPNTCTRDEQVCCAAAKTCMKNIVLAQLTKYLEYMLRTVSGYTVSALCSDGCSTILCMLNSYKWSACVWHERLFRRQGEW